jgi:hypothetical protein
MKRCASYLPSSGFESTESSRVKTVQNRPCGTGVNAGKLLFQRFQFRGHCDVSAEVGLGPLRGPAPLAQCCRRERIFAQANSGIRRLPVGHIH